MEEGYYKKLWWEIILTTLGFSVIPLFILGAVIYQQFSASYSAKIMEDMKTLAENRSASIDLFFDERISQLTGLAQGSHSVEVIGKNDAGLYQNDAALGEDARCVRPGRGGRLPDNGGDVRQPEARRLP